MTAWSKPQGPPIHPIHCVPFRPARESSRFDLTGNFQGSSRPPIPHPRAGHSFKVNRVASGSLPYAMGVAHHAAHAVRRTGPNYRLFTSGRSRRSRAHSCGSSVDRVRASTANCGRRVNAKVECNLRLGSRLHQHSAGRCHLYEKIAVTRHILWTASFEGRVLRSTWVSYADIWRRANSVSLIERQRSAARTSAPNISFNG